MTESTLPNILFKMTESTWLH